VSWAGCDVPLAPAPVPPPPSILHARANSTTAWRPCPCFPLCFPNFLVVSWCACCPCVARVPRGQSMIAFVRAVGPAMGSLLVAWSLDAGLPFPLDQNFTFLLAGAITLTPVALSFLLHPSFNKI
jgi:hypothetical protein